MRQSQQSKIRPLQGKLVTLLGYLLLGVGLLEPLGYIFDLATLEQVGFLTVASPLPLVFTDRDGMEDFASEYTLEWTLLQGSSHHKSLTSEDFAHIEGPFNRKGVYATAVGYAPRLPASIWKPVLKYGFCDAQILSHAIGVFEPLESLKLTIKTKTSGRNDQWSFGVNCKK